MKLKTEMVWEKFWFYPVWATILFCSKTRSEKLRDFIQETACLALFLTRRLCFQFHHLFWKNMYCTGKMGPWITQEWAIAVLNSGLWKTTIQEINDFFNIISMFIYNMDLVKWKQSTNSWYKYIKPIYLFWY